MRTPTLELLIPAAVRTDAVLRVLQAKLDLVEGGETAADRVVLDSFDGRLQAAGLALERPVSATGDGAWELALRSPGAPDERVTFTPARADRVLATDLPEGRVRERLAAVLGERAALPLARVASRTTAYSVLNSDEKTVVRLQLERPELRAEGGGAPALDSRLHVIGVRGYDKQFERVCWILQGDIGLKPPERTLAEEAARSAGRPVAPKKLRVRLAPGMRTDRSAQTVCRALAQHVEANLDGTLADLDPEFLHDFRVAIRRSRSVLREFRRAFGPADWRHARENLRWVQQVTGATRDLDVALLEWDALVAPLRPETRRDLEPLRALIERRRSEAFAGMTAALTSTEWANVWADWQRLLARPLHREPDVDRPDAARTIAAVAGERIREVYRRMRKEGRAIGDDSPPEALHDLRKRGKELRYLLELFGGLWDSEAEKPLVRALKELQDALGRFQDRQVQAEFLRGLGPELAKGRGGPDALIALGLVIDRLEADQRAARAEFAERFAAFADDATRDVVRTAFGRPGAKR